MDDTFPLIIINARPAAGKSEIINALQELPQQELAQRFHLGPMHILDDFPMLWAWFEEDRILQDVFNRPRLHTTPDEYFIHEDLWHLLIRRLALDHKKWRRDNPGSATAIIEFSRGLEHGGYRHAYPHLGESILSQAAAIYVEVSFAESLRKNRTRFDPDRPDSILQHSLSEEKLRTLYTDDDWNELSEVDPHYLHIGSARVPYVVFENDDDVTTSGGETLYRRLEECFSNLWLIHQSRPTV